LAYVAADLQWLEAVEMTITDNFLDSAEIHPIDLVEMLANQNQWEYDRSTEDQIAVVVVGNWRNYSVTLAWSEPDETLRLICSFDMEPPRAAIPKLYEALNLANDKCWTGGFSFWKDHRLMAYRYGMVLTDGATVSAAQIDQLIQQAVSACERYYPAFQLACWGEQSPRAALDAAITQTYGRA
jgi:hypothetical protein